MQDTLIRAYRAIDRFDGAHPRAWLLTILRNTQINRTHGTGLTGSQWTALAVAALSTWWLLIQRRTPGRKVDEPERVPL